MSRQVRDIALSKSTEFVTSIMEDYISKNRLQKVHWKRREWVYRSKYDVIHGQWFLKWSYQNEILHLETWYYEVFGLESAKRAPSRRRYSSEVTPHPFERSLTEIFSCS